MRNEIYVLLAPEDDEVISGMRRLMGKVEEMKTQRKTLEEKLRKDIHADDVTSALVTREGSSQEVSIVGNMTILPWFQGKGLHYG